MVEIREICVLSQTTNLAQVAEFVISEAQEAGLDETQVFEIQMAVDEACSNSMEHAYEGVPNGNLRVCCSLLEDEFVVRITDYGKPFDPTDFPAPDTKQPLEDRQIGGLGIFLMRQLVDQLEYATEPETGGNQITLHKRLK